MSVNLGERVNWLEEDDANNGEREVDDASDDVIVEDAIVLGLHLMQESAEGPKDKDDQREGNDHDC